MLSYVTGTVNQELLLRNEYLGAENRILRGQIKGRLLLSEGEKATLAEIAQRLGRKALEELAAVAKPDTLLAWYRELITNKFDGSKFRQQVGRPRMDEEAERLVVQMAKENPSWRFCCPISGGCTGGTVGAIRLQREGGVDGRIRWLSSEPSPALARIRQLRPLLSDKDLCIKVERMIFLSDQSNFKAGQNFCPAQVSAETQVVGGDIMRRWFNDRKFHAFLNVSVAPGVDINRVFGNILHAKHSRFLSGRTGLSEQSSRKNSSQKASETSQCLNERGGGRHIILSRHDGSCSRSWAGTNTWEMASKL
jgi:hypothetical protein